MSTFVGRRRMLAVGLIASMMSGASFAGAFAQSTGTAPSRPDSISNKERVETAMRAGEFTKIMSPGIKWTIVGNSLASGTTLGLDAFLKEKFNPNFARLSTYALTRLEVYETGDTVIARFDGKGTAKDGVPYSNNYVWFLKMKDGLAVEGETFMDSVALNELWTRVKVP